ncbi:hypothetical protein BLJ79_20000 [Arthrobacter sp. UCD-GKA]|uniref:hypothetical protein n=1 Tax=Arthrobacter sp. UCD-GKA TaxID=1913576 RepID=UPI0008DDFCC2|nr:hypothetical protein [Arthrobacter sp. UCD-GKA]OIH82216.1 hypothetical protein BLJ79_20000 [Arthrobacter sp. UCD-GKA]
MTDLEKQMKSIQNHLALWAQKAKKDYPEQLEHSVRSAVDRLDPAALAHASEEVIATVTGNRKTARRARKVIERSLVNAKRKAGTRHRAKVKALACLGILAAIGILVAVAVRRASHGSEPVAYRGPRPTPSEEATADPDFNI